MVRMDLAHSNASFMQQHFHQVIKLREFWIVAQDSVDSLNSCVAKVCWREWPLWLLRSPLSFRWLQRGGARWESIIRRHLLVHLNWRVHRKNKVWLGFAVSLENNFVLFLPAGFPMGYAAAAPAYSPNMYPGANPTFQTGMCNRGV